MQGIFIPTDSCTRHTQTLYGCIVDPDVVQRHISGSALHPCCLSLEERFSFGPDEYPHSSFLPNKSNKKKKIPFRRLTVRPAAAPPPGEGRRHRKLIVPMGVTQSEAAYVVSGQSDADEITKLGVVDDTKPSGTIRANEHMAACLTSSNWI